MKNITLSADEHLIEAACCQAASENTTLNAKFCEWLEEYVRDGKDEQAVGLIKK